MGVGAAADEGRARTCGGLPADGVAAASDPWIGVADAETAAEGIAEGSWWTRDVGHATLSSAGAGDTEGTPLVTPSDCSGAVVGAATADVAAGNEDMLSATVVPTRSVTPAEDDEATVVGAVAVAAAVAVATRAPDGELLTNTLEISVT